MEKIPKSSSSLFGSLRKPPPPPPPQTAAPASAPSAELLARLEAFEKRLEEVAKVALPPAEGEPPRPPTEVMLFLQQRLSVVEEKLHAAEAEAIRANILLREREDAQKKAQTEVEDLFRTIREQTRAASFDGKLREEFAAQQQRSASLEARLEELQKHAVPAEQILALWEQADGRARLEHLLEEKARQAASQPPPAEAAARPAAPSPAPPAGAAADAATAAVLLGKLADLERRLVEAEKERDQEKARRFLWEKTLATQLDFDAKRFERTGGSKLLFEAALESSVAGVQQRDALAAEISELIKRLDTLPAGASQAAALRERLGRARASLRETLAQLERHAAMVKAYLARDTPRGKP